MIRDAVDALLKENAELRALLAQHTGIATAHHTASEAGAALLKRLDDLDTRITEYLLEMMLPDDER